MPSNESLEELAAVRKAAREQKERKRLERRAARLAAKQGGSRAAGVGSKAVAPVAVGDTQGNGAAADTAAIPVVRPMSKAEKKAAIKEAKRRRKEAKRAATATKKVAKSAGAQWSARLAGDASGQVGADAKTTSSAPRAKKRGLGSLAKQLERERQQKRSKGVLMKHGKYDYANMSGGKISAQELAQLRSETTEQGGYGTQLIGYTLGWSKSNGGFGSKADTIARNARTHGTVGKARSTELT